MPIRKSTRADAAACLNGASELDPEHGTHRFLQKDDDDNNGDMQKPRAPT